MKLFGLFAIQAAAVPNGQYCYWTEWTNDSSNDGCITQQLRTCQTNTGDAGCCGDDYVKDFTNTCTDGQIWSDWGEWGDCNYLTRTKKRYRECLAGDPYCKGKLEGQQACKQPVIWSDWGSWSDCDERGIRVRAAECLRGPPFCWGNLLQPEECVPEQIWGEWNNWSYCNVFTGKRSRSAACVGGRPHCIDDLYESEVCWRGFFWQNKNWNRNRHQLPSVGSRLLPTGGAKTESKTPVKKTTSNKKKIQKKPQEAGYNVNIWKYQKPAKGKVHFISLFY